MEILNPDEISLGRVDGKSDLRINISQVTYGIGIFGA